MSDTMRNVETRGPDPTQPAEPDLSLGELLGRLSTDFGDLIVTHVELAKTELREEANKAGKGAGMMAVAGVAALLALTLLSFAAAWGLDEVMHRALAFVIVGVVWTALAAILFQRGRQEMTAMRGIPQTKASVEEDIAWAKQQKS